MNCVSPWSRREDFIGAVIISIHGWLLENFWLGRLVIMYVFPIVLRPTKSASLSCKQVSKSQPSFNHDCFGCQNQVFKICKKKSEAMGIVLVTVIWTLTPYLSSKVSLLKVFICKGLIGWKRPLIEQNNCHVISVWKHRGGGGHRYLKQPRGVYNFGVLCRCHLLNMI